MDHTSHLRTPADDRAERLDLIATRSLSRLDEPPAALGSTDPEMALEAAFLVRSVAIAGEHRAALRG